MGDDWAKQVNPKLNSDKTFKYITSGHQIIIN